MTEKTYLVYKHTAPNGRAYIGCTSSYQKRCTQHKKGSQCTDFSEAIVDYGWDSFSHEIIKDGLTKEEGYFWEDFYINHFNTMTPNGYNLISGGLKRKYSEKSKIKMSESAKGRSSWNKGRTLSDEHKKKLSEAKKGKPGTSIGKVFSDEHKAKLSIARRKRVTSQETREKMSVSLKGKKRTAEQLINYKSGAIKAAETRKRNRNADQSSNQ